MNKEIKILKTEKQTGYELLDEGEGEKLERYGKYVFRRPDPQALWYKTLETKKWDDADFIFKRQGRFGSWKIKKGSEESFNIQIGDLKFKVSPTAFKHTGLFPEQFPNWTWMRNLIKNAGRKVSVLNLFAYTGGASVSCAKEGAKVTHVDASKPSIGWAKDNAKLSGLKEDSIKWILDDALEFVKREARRGNKYDGIIMDPPAFGRGPKGEVWNIEEKLLELIKSSKEILSNNPLFFLINGYASGYSPITYKNNIEDLKEKFEGSLESGELTLEDSRSKLLPAGIFARWCKG